MPIRPSCAGYCNGKFHKTPIQRIARQGQMTEKLTLATKSKFEQGGFTHHWHILNAMLVEPWPAVLYDDKLSQLLPYPSIYMTDPPQFENKVHWWAGCFDFENACCCSVMERSLSDYAVRRLVSWVWGFRDPSSRSSAGLGCPGIS